MRIISKKALCIALTFFTAINTFILPAKAEEEIGARVYEYTIGSTEYNLELAEYAGESVGAVYENESLVMSDDAKAVYKFYLPFDSEMAEFSCRLDNASEVIITVGNNVKNVQLSAEDTMFSYQFENVVRKGDAALVIECSSEITISDVVFYKVKKEVSYEGTDESRAETEYTDFEAAIQTAVIINKNSSVMLVNGAKKYIDYNDTEIKPYISAGKVYLPVHALSVAFGCYYEEDYEDEYFILRNDKAELLYENGVLRKQEGIGDYVGLSEAVEEQNGSYYLAIDCCADAFGKALRETDEYIITEQSAILADEIVNNHINDLDTIFSPFVAAKKTGNTYYVSKTANAYDGNSGLSENAPFATLARACYKAKAGDRVIIGGGTYRETLTPLASGTGASPIIFEAKENEIVTISALDEVTSTPSTDGDMLVYSMGDWNLGYGRNQVFYKGEAIAEGRHPNTPTSPRYFPEKLNLSPLWPTQGNIQVKLDGSNTAVSTTDLSQADDYWVGGTLVSVHGLGYGVSTAKITDSSDGVLTYGSGTARTIRSWHTYADGSDLNLDFGYITGCKNSVDIPGEWYWVGGTLYIIPPNGETAESLKLEAKARQLTVNLTGKSYIQLKNINTIGGGMKLNDSTMCIVNGGTHKYISHYTFHYDFEHGYIDNSNVYSYTTDNAMYRGEVGVFTSGNSNALVNMKIYNSAGAGICLGGTYHHIENNLLEECGYMGAATNGIVFVHNPSEAPSYKRGGFTIYRNTVNKTGRASINLSSWQYPYTSQSGLAVWIASDIAYNHFLNANINTRDNGSVYAYASVLGTERAKTKVHHNLVGSSFASDGYASGIYWDNFSQMIECHDNIIYCDDKVTAYTNAININDNKPETAGDAELWNNVDAGYLFLGKNGLTLSDYPLGKYFRAGAFEKYTYKNSNQEYLARYDEPKQLTADEQLSFNNVSISDNDELKIVFTGDKYKNADTLTVSVGELAKNVTLCAGGSPDTLNEVTADIDGIAGIQTIRISTDNDMNCGIAAVYLGDKSVPLNSLGISVTEDENNYYLSGSVDTNSDYVAISQLKGYENKEDDFIDVSHNTSNNLSCSFKKPSAPGTYSMNIFKWKDLASIIPIEEAFKLSYYEKIHKNAYWATYFADAEVREDSIASNGVWYTCYAKTPETIMFENVDFGDESPDLIDINYGLDVDNNENFKIEIYMDEVADENIIATLCLPDTVSRFTLANIRSEIARDDITGVHDIYFIVTRLSASDYPLTLNLVKFRK